MSPRIASLPSSTGLYRICLVISTAMLITGCQDAGKAPPPTSKDLPQASALPPLDTELSSTNGVSIKRLPDDDATSFVVFTRERSLKTRASLFSILSFVAPGWLRNDAALPGGIYAVLVRPPDEEGEEEMFHHAWVLLIPAFEQAFQVKIRPVKRVEDVLVLSISNHALSGLKEAKESDQKGHGTSAHGYEFRNQSFTDLAEFLAERLGQFVLDETKNEAKHTFDVPVNVFAMGDADNWASGLKKVGVDLRKAQREIEFILVEKAPSRGYPHSP